MSATSEHEAWIRMAKAAGRLPVCYAQREPAHTNGYRRQRRKRGYRHWPGRVRRTFLADIYGSHANALWFQDERANQCEPPSQGTSDTKTEGP